MWTLGIVVFPPLFNQDLRFLQAVEGFSVKQFISETGVEALAVSVFPWRTRFDVRGLGTHSVDPVPDGLSNEFRPVVRSDVGWDSPKNEEIYQRVNHVGGIELSLHSDRQALAGMFIQDVQGPERLSIIGSAMHEVITPDMIGIFRSQPDT
ncbi:hypothetical protein LA5094_06347 [Roseibium album]|nr:hypothetical protein LA5094_06347 [Roseibium album]